MLLPVSCTWSWRINFLRSVYVCCHTHLGFFASWKQAEKRAAEKTALRDQIVRERQKMEETMRKVCLCFSLFMVSLRANGEGCCPPLYGRDTEQCNRDPGETPEMHTYVCNPVPCGNSNVTGKMIPYHCLTKTREWAAPAAACPAKSSRVPTRPAP